MKISLFEKLLICKDHLFDEIIAPKHVEGALGVSIIHARGIGQRAPTSPLAYNGAVLSTKRLAPVCQLGFEILSTFFFNIFPTFFGDSEGSLGGWGAPPGGPESGDPEAVFPRRVSRTETSAGRDGYKIHSSPRAPIFMS